MLSFYRESWFLLFPGSASWLKLMQNPCSKFIWSIVKCLHCCYTQYKMYGSVIELLKDSEERGLVHQIIFFPSPQFYYVICNCCTCCCLSLSNFFKKGTPQVVKSEFIVATDTDRCTDCGTCVQRCHFGARRIIKNKISFSQVKCFGCGLCVSKCPERAISLVRKKTKSS